MANHDDINTARSIDNVDEDEKWVIDSIVKAIPPWSTARIPRVPIVLKETSDIYDRYYVPKIVSIGPYHYGNPMLESVQKLKPAFTMKLLSLSEYEYDVGLSSLYKKLGEANMVQELRKFYEEKSTDHLPDKEFTRMMLVDGCFILYYIQFIYGEKAGSCGELRSRQIVLIHQDLFLLENQIPYIVVQEVMNLIKLDHRSDKIQSFFTYNILAPQSYQNDGRESQKSLKLMRGHLLHHLHFSLTRTSDHLKQSHGHRDTRIDEISSRCTFRSASDLADVGIYFKPSSVMSIAHAEFVRRRWCFIADVKLPPITVDDSTKPMLLNLIAYEMCSDDTHAWVTSYICLLDSLIDQPEDVRVLRKAGVLDNSLGSDKEVATLFNEIGTDLVPNSLAYAEVKNQIQRRYERVGKTWLFGLRNFRLSQLKKEYIQSPWSFLALLGAMMALFLTSVQTYFTVWAPKGECDDLCMFLKMNHHL